jgi:hypothetical protein
MVMPPGMKHYAWTPAEAIIQVQGMGPFVINYVNPTDDPRNASSSEVTARLVLSGAIPPH